MFMDRHTYNVQIHYMFSLLCIITINKCQFYDIWYHKQYNGIMVTRSMLLTGPSNYEVLFVLQHAKYRL